jgi:predicted N-acyltransferase
VNCPTVNSFKSALRSQLSAFPKLFRNSLLFSIHESIEEIDPKLWDGLNGDKSIFLSFQLLKAISASQYAAQPFFFCIFHEKQIPVGICVFHIANLEADNLEERSGSRGLVGLIGRKISRGQEKRILICGSAFATGEHGYWFAPSVDRQRAMNSVCEALTKILDNEEEQKRKISAVLIKDFYSGRFDEADKLQNCGFRSFNVDHNMIMPILSEWTSFEHYLDALNSKFRTKARAAFNRSSELIVRDLTATEIEQYAERIQALYDNVHEKADFKIGHLNVALFACMKREMSAKLIFRSYWEQERMIGFSIALDSDQGLEAFVVGIDYRVNTQFAMYSRMLYDYISIAIERKKHRIVFGRTAGEIKSTVGAFPVDLRCCIRHPGRISNGFLSLIFKYVEPTPFPIRHPYKETTLLAIKHHTF